MLDFLVQCPAKTLRARGSTSKTMQVPRKCLVLSPNCCEGAIENKEFQGNIFFDALHIIFDPHGILFDALNIFLDPSPVRSESWSWSSSCHGCHAPWKAQGSLRATRIWSLLIQQKRRGCRRLREISESFVSRGIMERRAGAEVSKRVEVKQSDME